tara:strand:- start:1236 stop:1430 length:195 start_codon:yes stop_codon:yes gene_type:complete
MNTLVLFFALDNEGTLHSIGHHSSYDSADRTAEKLGLDVVWLANGDEAKQWASTILNSMEVATF